MPRLLWVGSFETFDPYEDFYAWQVGPLFRELGCCSFRASEAGLQVAWRLLCSPFLMKYIQIPDEKTVHIQKGAFIGGDRSLAPAKQSSCGWL